MMRLPLDSLLQFYQLSMMKDRIFIATLLLTFAFVIIHQTFVNQTSIERQEIQKERKLKTNDVVYDVGSANKVQLAFSEWCHKYGKVYASDEEKLYRMNVYNKNVRQIEEHNALYRLGKSTFTKGMNKYGDLTPTQWTSMFNWKEDYGLKITKECNGSIMDAPNPPAELDWGNKVSQVRNQGTCGKDWAMVAAEAIQSLYALKLGSLPYLSTQQLVECSVDYGNEGCYGGFMDQAFAYVIDNGIALDKSYPVREPVKCKYILNMKFTSITRCARVPSKSYSKLLSAIVQQPVSIALDQNPDMLFYSQGVYDGKCTSTLNHGMLLVGYGGKQAENYFWRLKNTVGTSWGEGGFIKLPRVESDGQGKCGMQIWPSVPQGIV